MDVRDISNVIVAKNCARTASVGVEVADGLNIPIGTVQTQIATLDNGNAATSYYGPGEVVITDSVGNALDNTVTKATTGIKFVNRSYNGESHFGTKLIKGANITSYNFIPYAPRVEQTTIIHTIDNSPSASEAFTYMFKIRKVGSTINKLKDPTVKTIKYRAAAGETAAQIATGLVAYINANFANDLIIPVTAVVGGAGNDAVIITAQPYTWSLGKFRYERLSFWVELVNFEAVLVNNMYGSLTYNAITYDPATIGAGAYEQVAEAEFFAKAYTGANRNLMSPAYRRTEVPIDAQKYEDDGVTPNRYDTVVINWENTQGDFSANVNQMGSIVLYLPLDNNGVNQQADLIATLNQYIVTAYGLPGASAIVLSV